MKSIVRAIAILLTAGSAFAQQWSPTSGPDGGSVLAMSSTTTTVLAVVSPGVVYRHVAGEWERLGRLSASSLHSIGNTFLAVAGDTLYRSTDRGESWSAVGPRGFGMKVSVDRGFLYAGVDSAIHRSTDGGVTWSRIAATGMDFYSFIVRDSVVLIARGSSAGVYRSTDLGGTWSRVTSGLPDSAAPQAFHRQGPELLMAVDGRGVFRSTDDGASWIQMNLGLPKIDGVYPALQSFVGIGQDIWVAGRGGTYVHTGGRWHTVSAEDDRILAVREGEVYLGSRRGVTVASDTGTWRRFNPGLIAHRVTAIERFGNALLVSAAGQIYRSTDRGGFWTPSAAIDAGQFAVAGDRQAYAVGRNFFRSGIFRTTDGLDWGEVAAAGLPHPLRWIGAIAAAGDTVFIGYNHMNWDGSGPIWEHGGVYRSLDRGATWSPVNTGLPNDGHGEVPVRDLTLVDGVLIAQTADGIYRTTDGGEHWTHAHPPGVFPDMRGVSATIGSAVYIVTSDAVLRSTDLGVTWSPTGEGIPASANVGHLSSVRGVLYASALIDGELGHVFRLSEGRWTEITQLLPAGAQFETFVELGDRVFVGTAWNSVWSGTFDPSAGVRYDASRLAGSELAVYPNPFGSYGTIRFRLREAGHVRLTLTSQLGRTIATLHDGVMSEGAHDVVLPVDALAAGLYHVRMMYGGRVRTVAVMKGQ